MKNKEGQNAGAKLKTPGLIPGMIAGLILGLLTQIYYLGFIAWEVPYWRMIGGSLGGIVLGLILTVILGKGFYWLKLLPKDQPYRFPGYALLITALLGWPIWDILAERGFLWLTLPFWLITTFSLGRIYSLLVQYSSEQKQKLLLTTCLIVVLLFGLSLRLAGLSHGLPDYIVHCDSFKQLQLIPQFIEGDPEPPDSYPVGHIYFYSNILRLWRAITGINSPVPELNSQTLKDLTPYILFVRAFQAFLGSFIPLFAFLVGRNLWGPWTGLLASFLVACDPIHLTYCRQEMGEIPQTFWVMACLWFSTQFLKSKKGIDIFLAGLCAGLAVAMKIYGGYIVLTAMTAVLFSPFRKFRGIALVLGGMFCGMTFGSYFWFNPTSWFNNLVGESIVQLLNGSIGTLLSKSQLDPIKIGLIYFWRGMAYRFHLPWMILSLLGIGFLFLRHRKEERFFLVPTICALLIIGFRLSYLREWDFVNLSPFLAIAIASLIISWLKHLWGYPFYRNIALLLLGFFLTFQTLVALSDAGVARFPDTRQLAKRWVLQHVDAGSRLLYDTKISGGTWIPVNAGITVIQTPVKEQFQDKNIPDSPPLKTTVVEQFWGEPPLNSHLYQPVQVFDLRNTYWENPIINFFRLDVNQSSSDLILPHSRVRSPEPAFLGSRSSQCQPFDLLSNSVEMKKQYLFNTLPINQMGYTLLGHGQGSIFFGPALGFPTEVKMGGITSGFFTPYRRVLPWFPRTYKVALVPKPGNQVLWLGIYPKPEQMSPLLFRYEAWPDLERIARLGLGRKNAPSELSLFYATALAAQGKHEAANQELARLHQHQPGFLSLYRRLAASKEENFNITLGKMADATQAELLAESIFWPKRFGDLGELDQLWPDPSIKSESNYFHMWLPHTFLPGFLEANLQVEVNPPNSSRLIVIGFQSNFFSKELARIDLKPNIGSLRLSLQIPTGPIHLEFRLESDRPIWPKIISLQIKPDYKSKFSWRWKVITKYMKEIERE